MIEVLVPATSANCGIGFDSLGLALEMFGHFCFEESDSLLIEGCPAQYCTEDNLVYQAFAETARRKQALFQGVHITIDSPIPFARGLGSSSSCIVAGILGANYLLHLDLEEQEMLQIATAIEGHPDNVAPALLGGMTACFMEQNEVFHTNLDIADFKALVFIPDYEVSTPMARKVLPRTIEFHDASRQVGRALVFEKAIESGNQRLVCACLQDALHEPYRKRLIPEYDQIEKMAADRNLPFWISGSGPTLLILSLEQEALELLAKDLRCMYPNADIEILSIDKKGPRVLVHEQE